MKKRIYTIYDSKAKMHNNPFYMLNDQVAMRACKQLANDPNTDIGQSTGDFSLFYHGTFDDSDASFELLATPEMVTNLAFLTDEDQPNEN